MPPACSHTNTQLVARRGGVDYVHCLDCGQIFEADELEATPPADEDDGEQPTSGAGK